MTFPRDWGKLKLLAHRRKAARLSQEQMAFKSGITGGQISKLERDAYEPRLATLYALADALGVGPCDLIPRKH